MVDIANAESSFKMLHPKKVKSLMAEGLDD
jgi:hypothetical protein